MINLNCYAIDNCCLHHIPWMTCARWKKLWVLRNRAMYLWKFDFQLLFFSRVKNYKLRPWIDFRCLGRAGCGLVKFCRRNYGKHCTGQSSQAMGCRLIFCCYDSLYNRIRYESPGMSLYVFPNLVRTGGQHWLPLLSGRRTHYFRVMTQAR